MKIAIIGSEGFVGNACVHIFEKKAEVIKIDPRLGTSISDIEDGGIDVALICVPTPMGPDGKIDATIVESVMSELQRFSRALIVLKSTVLPDIVDKFAKLNKKFIYNPEFLTERNAKLDAEYPFMTVLGGEIVATKEMELIYKHFSICESAPYYHMGVKEASFVKYGINSFLSTKVLFFNQLHDLVESVGGDYEEVKNAIGTDPRIGMSHTNVPGHDGRKGASGPCFGKDIPALVQYSKTSGREFSILKESWNRNCEYRLSYENRLPREIEQHIEFSKID